jgi:2-isopropylmalate synthase
MVNMRKIKIFDTTLRDGEQSPGCSMGIVDKIKVAKKLDEMGVDVIEAGFAASSDNDFMAIKEISKVVEKATVTSLARCNINDINMAYEAIKEAKKPRIHIFIATSDIQMRDKLNKTKEEIKDIVIESVRVAKSKCDDIEFSLEDATRTDRDFACEVIDIAVREGATVINIPDTVGFIMPSEFSEFIEYIKNNSRVNEVILSVHCHNDLGLATSNSMAAIMAGADQVECTINGIGERAGNTALEEVVANIKTRDDYYNCMVNIDTTKIYDISSMIVNITGSVVQNNKPIVGRNAFRHEAGIHQAGVIKNRETYEIMDPRDYGIVIDNLVIGIHSGKNAIIDKMKKMGYEVNEYDIDNIVREVKEYCGYNKNIADGVLERIIENNIKFKKI